MAITPKAGDLREVINVQTRGEVVDQFGNPQMGWKTVVSNLPAQIAVQKGGEAVQAARVVGLGLYDITVRYSDVVASLTATDRIVNARTGKTYGIKWVGDLEGRRRFLTITCQTGAAE